MASVMLRDEMVGEKTIEVVQKAALSASKCDGCGRVFEMRPWCNDEGLAHLRGTFEERGLRVVDAEGDYLGNSFGATACSFACAHDLFTGGWRNMPQYEPFAKADAVLVRGELKLTALVKDEKQLVAEWEQAAEWKPYERPRWFSSTGILFGTRRPTEVDADSIQETSRALSDLADGVLVRTRREPPKDEVEMRVEVARAEAFREAAAIVARLLEPR